MGGKVGSLGASRWFYWTSSSGQITANSIYGARLTPSRNDEGDDIAGMREHLLLWREK